MASNLEIVVAVKDLASGKLAEIGKKLDNVGAANTTADKAMGKATDTNHRYNLSLKGMAFTLLSVEAALYAMGGALTAVGTMFVGYNAKMEQAKISYTTFLGSADAADQFINKMKDFSSVTPFSFETLDNATKKMFGLGFAANEIFPTLEAVGNAMAAIGMGPETFDRVILALGQMGMKAKVSAEELKQLNEAGIDARKYLAEAFNLTMDQVAEIGDQNINGYKGMQAIIEGMAKDPKFTDMMAKQSKTLLGQWETLKDNSKEIFGSMGKDMFDSLTGAMTDITAFTQKWAQETRTSGFMGGLLNAVDDDKGIILLNMKKGFEELGAAANEAKDAVKEFNNLIGDSILLEFSEEFRDLAGVIHWVAKDAKERMVYIREGAEIIGAGWDWLGQKADDLHATVLGAWSAITGVTDDLVSSVGLSMDNAGSALDGLGGVASWLEDKFREHFGGILVIVDKFQQAMRQVRDEVRNFFNLGAVDEAASKLAAWGGKKFDAAFNYQQYRDKLKSELNVERNVHNDAYYKQMYDRTGQIAAAEKLNKGRESNIPAGSGKPDKKAEAAERKYENALQKMNEMSASLDQKISELVDDDNTAKLAKLSADIIKMKNDIADAAAAGVDTTDVTNKLETYRTTMANDIKKKFDQAQAQFVAGTNSLLAANSEDRKAIIEAEYQETLTKLNKEVEDWRKAGYDKAEIDRRFTAEKAAAEKKRTDALAEENKKQYDLELQHNQNLYDMKMVSLQQLDNLNKQELESKIAYLDAEIEKARDNKEKRIKLEQEKADTIKKLNEIGARDMKLGAALAIDEISNKYLDYRQTVVDVFDAINTTAEDHWTKMLTGQESFSSAFTNILQDMTNEILKMMAKIIYYQLVYQPLNNFFTNMIGGMLGGGGTMLSGARPAGVQGPSGLNGGFFKVGGNADGNLASGWRVVGEHGPELVNFDTPGAVYPSQKSLKQLQGSGETNVVVNINGVQQPVQNVRQESHFDGTATVVDLWLDGYARNVNGMRTILQGGGL